MDKKHFLETLQFVRAHSQKRNFTQSVDLIINLRGLNLKKPEEMVNTFVALPHPKGKESKVAALVGNDLVTKAKEACDVVIHKDEFHDYGTNPKKTKKMAKGIDFFIAQANLMPDVAKAFGKTLGPLGKMPNPKAGAVVPPIIPSLKPIVEKLKNTVKLHTKNELVVKCFIGSEKMSDDELAENAFTVYNHIFHFLHEDSSKIVNVLLKLTMGRPFIVTKKYTPEELQEPNVKSKKTSEKKEIKEEKPKETKTKAKKDKKK